MDLRDAREGGRGSMRIILRKLVDNCDELSEPYVGTQSDAKRHGVSKLRGRSSPGFIA